jgi:predicted lipase
MTSQQRFLAWVLCCQSYLDNAIGWTEVEEHRFTVREIERDVYICVTGTKEWENWFDNLEIHTTPSPSGKYLCHAGFKDVFDLLWPHIERELAQFTKAENIIPVGHSLGGAEAVLIAEHLGRSPITFGAPPVYSILTGTPDLNHDRFARRRDPVPMLLPLTYQHDSEKLLLLDASKSFLPCVKEHDINKYDPRGLK